MQILGPSKSNNKVGVHATEASMLCAFCSFAAHIDQFHKLQTNDEVYIQILVDPIIPGRPLGKNFFPSGRRKIKVWSIAKCMKYFLDITQWLWLACKLIVVLQI